jgi:SAM-dependent methyltransferase
MRSHRGIEWPPLFQSEYREEEKKNSKILLLGKRILKISKKTNPSMTISFRDYLDVKTALDERSLNPVVRTVFLDTLRGREWLTCLDLGTGTGASLWRLLNAELSAGLAITAVDRDPVLLDIAFKRTTVLLRARGFTVSTPAAGSIRARRGTCHIAIDFIAADLQHFNPVKDAGRFDAVIAHQVMDLLPPRTMAERIAGWLRPRGVFYATLNYEGETALFPVYREVELEDRILAVYDASMEKRRVWDQASGGARSGRRLYGALLENGFAPLAYGSSDWNLAPLRRAYLDRDDLCLIALLDMIRDEATQSGEFSGKALDLWYRDRLHKLENGELGLIVHQIDLLAEKP